MSVKLTAYVWDGCAAAGIKGTKLMIMARLADFSSDEGISWPGIETIARQIGAGRSTVITAIGELEKAGWLTRKERRQGQRSATNLYTLNVQRLRAAAHGAYSHRSELKHAETGDSGSGHPKAERPEVEHSKSVRSGMITERCFQGSGSGGDPSVNSKHDPSDKKTLCQVAGQPDHDSEINVLAKQVLSHLNKTTSARFQMSDSSLNHIRARLAEGYTVAELQLVVDYKHEHWHDTEQDQYLRPKTLFTPANFPGYLKAAIKWDRRGRPSRSLWGRDVFGNNQQRNITVIPSLDYDIPEGFRTE